MSKIKEVVELLKKVQKPHPWHGIPSREEAGSDMVKVYVEIVPTDTIKYEVCKDSGYLMIDRPQKFSNIIPALYGFVPQTYCAEASAEYTNKKLGRNDLEGDFDPLDICVLAQRNVPAGDLLVDAKIIGGFRMLDGGEVDDKVIAVLKDDAVYGNMNDITDCPESVINAMKHYFLTYKEIPNRDKPAKVEITHTYGKKDAMEILEMSEKDYKDHYDYQNKLEKLLVEL